ncbi:MAG: hypothetical protein V1861_01005 [Candidatus Micrarchaeota archaeon]
MAQSRVEKDDNVTIVYTKIPDAVYTSITVKPLEPMHQTVRLARESEAYLRRMGYSQNFCNALVLLLNSMTNTVINTAANEETLRRQRGPRDPNMDFVRPEQPIRMQMPTNLREAYMFLGEGREALLMPNCGPYFPNTTQYPDIYRAFASPEGQRFMSRYVANGWVRQDPATQEWIIAPPVPPSEIVPRRTEQPTR